MKSRHWLSFFILFCLSLTASTHTMDQVLAIFNYPKTLAAAAAGTAALLAAYRSTSEKLKVWEKYPQLSAAQALQKAIPVKSLQQEIISYVDDPNEKWVIHIHQTTPHSLYPLKIFDHAEIVMDENLDYNLLKVTHKNYFAEPNVVTTRIPKNIARIEDFKSSEGDQLPEFTVQGWADERIVYTIKTGPSEQAKKLKKALNI